MRVLIIAAGSMGCLVGAKLSLAHHEVIATGSPRIYEAINKNGLIYHDLEGKTYPIQNLRMIKSIATLDTCDLPEICIITSKAYSLPSIIQEYELILSQYSEVFLLQNGLGNEKLIGARFPNMILYRIISSNGATLKESHHIYQTGEGPSFLCRTYPIFPPLSPSITFPSSLSISHGQNNLDLLNSFLTALETCQMPLSISTFPIRQVWEKAIINCAINPMGALLQQSNGFLIDNPHFWEISGKVVEEILQVAPQLEISLNSHSYYMDQIRDVLKATRPNKNSMLQDIENQRPTEIDFLNGYITQMAAKFAILVPYNEILVALIRMKESAG
ncbi:MAG: 2-dehydropantoate 2-reductase [Promethearchaeota archaeon]|nr:MAG: 2-dehydropantoate 2-reductase [Candidatus Lokiarchaeota archaeon]